MAMQTVLAPSIAAADSAHRPLVKIPPDWLHEPHFSKRSDLCNARKAEMKQLALDKTRVSPYFDLNFARSEALFRDSFRKNGVQDVLNKASKLDPSDFHQRAIASGSPTRTVLLDKRTKEKRLESLKFEPPEIMRLRDIPKQGAAELESWWTKVNGYVEDPSPMIETSLRLQLSPHRRILGPVDPAKERSQASVDERRRVAEGKRQLAEKITKISHSIPKDYYSKDRVEAGVIVRATDLYAQEKREGSRNGSMRPESTHILPVSPIKPKQLKPTKRSQRHVESLYEESTNQRLLLDQLKTTSPRAPGRGTNSQSEPQINDLPRFSTALTHMESLTPEKHSVKDYRGSVRCGGFS